ncbi:MAG: hypothetical protein CL610_19810 [Anaerolineaceae bacterium]|nr:hypothetical protein [Anaerolineaceae bacterium]
MNKTTESDTTASAQPRRLHAGWRMLLILVAFNAPIVAFFFIVTPSDYGKLVVTALFYVPVSLFVVMLYGKDHRDELVALLDEADQTEFRAS